MPGNRSKFVGFGAGVSDEALQHHQRVLSQIGISELGFLTSMINTTRWYSWHLRIVCPRGAVGMDPQAIQIACRVMLYLWIM